METAFIETYFGVRAEARFTHVSDVPTSFGNFNINVTGAAESIDFGVKLAEIVGIRLNAIVSGLDREQHSPRSSTTEPPMGTDSACRYRCASSASSRLALSSRWYLFNYASGQSPRSPPCFESGPWSRCRRFYKETPASSSPLP